jgi:hypothetical protein
MALPRTARETHEKRIAVAIRLTWDSLESHMRRLPELKRNARERKIVGSIPFHKQCIREYAEIIRTLADSL